MASSPAFPQAHEWSPEINIEDPAFFHYGPPVVPFRNLPCSSYRILYTHGGGNDWDESLVLTLEDKFGKKFAAWSPVSVCQLAKHISKASFIDFVGFGKRDAFGSMPVVIRLAHPPNASTCSVCLDNTPYEPCSTREVGIKPVSKC